MKSTEKSLTREQKLIEIVKNVTGSKFIGDDCAVLPSGQLLSSDMLVENRHFLLELTDLNSLGWKCIAVNLSDMAAMGVAADYLIVDIAWPAKLSDSDFQQLYQGMQECAQCYGAVIVGGDITGSEKLVCAITVLGKTNSNDALLRSSAKEGDLVIVSGDFGASAAGLKELLGDATKLSSRSYPIDRHLRPSPRIAEAKLLAELSCGTAALMDTSDGLADAALQIAAASSVAIELEADLIPVHSETKRIAVIHEDDPLELALYGGEDYELFACVRESDWSKISKIESCPFKKIGKVMSGGQVTLRFKNAKTSIIDNARTYQHFDAE